MKKGTIAALIIASILIFTGAILLTLGLSFAGNDPRESTLIRQEVLLSEPFDRVVIDTEDCDVKFVPYNGDMNAQVVLLEQENVNHSVTVEDGVLKIEMIDKRNWTGHISIGRTQSMEMTVYLPATEYASAQVRTATGDITLAQEPVFLETVLRTSTGDISCVGISGDVLDCITSTGDISVQNSGLDTVKLQSDTGDVELEQVLAEDYLQVFTDTGRVEVNNSDAGSVNIETDTGDVSGNFISPKYFNAHSDTGNVTVPEGREGGECRIQTDSGDIRFK